MRQSPRRYKSGKDRGFRCASDTCYDDNDVGSAHLVWKCPQSQALKATPEWLTQQLDDSDNEKWDKAYTVEGGWRPIWIAVTALETVSTTNNLAEFVGLHRLMATAVKKGWKRLHVVGDSAFIINWMRKRSTPKHRRFQRWYRLSMMIAGQNVIREHEVYVGMAPLLENDIGNWRERHKEARG
ncbi:hypothetical protein PI125_g22723 [Phytophthora idaei]|nr:hypothetical protein PI125_g22723 [Phytophthora idaei]